MSSKSKKTIKKREDFLIFQDTFFASEYIKIRSFLWRNEKDNPAIKEIDAAVSHSFCPRPFLHNFTNEANESLARVFGLLSAKSKADKKKKK